MGHPTFNLDDSLGQGTPKPFNLDDSLSQESTPPKTGFEKIAATYKGFLHSYFDNSALAISALGDPYGASRVELVNKVINRYDNLKAAAPIFADDMVKFFDAFSKEQVKKVIDDSGLAIDSNTTSSEILTKPFKAVGRAVAGATKPFLKLSTYPELASGVVDMMARPSELLVGENFSEDNKPLTPQETAERSKHVLGDAIMILATHNVAGAIDRKLVGEGVMTAVKAAGKEGGLEALGTQELINAAGGSKVGAIARRAISNSIGGAVGGFAGGLVSASGQHDALEAALINGVMNVPLGFAQEFAVGKVQAMRGKILDTPEQVSELAKSIFNERQLKLYADDSYESALNKLEALRTSDDLSEAAKKLGGEKIVAEEYTPNDLSKGVTKYVISKNTIPGEKPWRISIFGENPGNIPVTIGHETFDTLAEARNHTKFLDVALGKTVKKDFDLEKFKQNFYDEFNHSAYKTSNIMDAEPENGFNFDRHLYDFAKEKGIGPEFVPGLRADILKRMQEEVVNSMEPDERFAYNKMRNSLEATDEKFYDDYLTTAARVNRKAAEQGMYLSKDADGTFIMRSMETGEKILEAKDAETLINTFAQDAGRPRANPKLIMRDVVGVPDDAVPIKPPTPTPTGKIPGNLDQPFNISYRHFEKLIDAWKKSKFGSLFTPVKETINALDNKNRTNFTQLVYDETQQAWRRTVGKLIDYHRELDAISRMGGTLTSEQWKQVAIYRQSRTAKELVDRFTKTRGVSALEQSQGQWLHDNDIDLEKVFAYRRNLNDLQTRFDGPELDQKRQELEVSLGMDSKHLDAYGRFETIIKGSRDNSDLGAVVAYARALKSGMSKADYAARNNMNRLQLRIAERLDSYYDKLANDFGIPDKRQLEDYMNHYQKYGEFRRNNDMSDLTEDFLSEMPRTGEIANYEDHPIVAAMRYTSAGVKVKEFNPVWNKARAAADGIIRNIPSESQRELAKFHIDSYLSGIKGNREFVSDGTAEHLANWFEGINGSKIGKMVGASFPITKEEVQRALRRWTSNYFGISESAAQGFRPSQGVRDFYGTLNNYYIRFGTARVNKALWLWNRMTPDQIHALELDGQIPTLQPYQVSIQSEAVSDFRGRLGNATQKFLEGSFAGSLQKTAYRNGHAMVYNETYLNTAHWLGELADAKVDKVKAYNKMGLHTYDPSIQQAFDRLVSSGKTEEATEYLARLTAAETTFAYGAANQPRLMTKLGGALLGQFGVWSSWESLFVTRMMSRGTIGQRLRAGTRYATSQSALMAADAITGLNLSTWMLTPAALVARLGPTGQFATNAADVTNPNQRIQKMATNAVKNEATLLLPSYQFLRGAKEAYSMWERGFDPVSVGLRGVGFGFDEQNRNWWDLVLRDIGGYEQGSQSIINQELGNEIQKRPSNAGRKGLNPQ